MVIEKNGMAWVGKVTSVSPIEGADLIQRTEVVCGKGGKWCGVTPKDIQANDRVIVFMPDAVVPQIKPLEFMEKRGWKVSMMRLRGCPSEVLICKYADLTANSMEVGTDVTALLSVKKYEKEIPAQLSGLAKGNFPSFIPKTDEMNFQTVPEFLSALRGKPYYITTKYDGSSQTAYCKNGEVGGCSRNLELKDNPGTAVWEIIRKYNLAEKLKALDNIAIQFECVGPGIQGNPLKLTSIEARVFNVFDIFLQIYRPWEYVQFFCSNWGIPSVEEVFRGESFPDMTDDDLRKMAEGVYTESGKEREGIVIRPLSEMSVNGERLSFKVINLRYKGA